MALTTDQMIEEIKGMSVLDLNTLVKALEEEFGVSAAAAVARRSQSSGFSQSTGLKTFRMVRCA